MPHRSLSFRLRFSALATLAWSATALAALLGLARPAAAYDGGERPALTQYVLDTWTVEDGLPQNSVNRLLQTRDGYLWIGTQEGLARFNGETFRIYDRSNAGLRANNVTALFETRAGTLWVGTQGGGVHRMQGDSLVAFGVAEGLPGDRVSDLVETGDGRLLVSTYDAGLARWTGVGFQAIDDEHLPRDINALAVTPDGQLWVASRSQGLFRVSSEGSEQIEAVGPETSVLDLHVSGSAVWATTRSRGLYRIQTGGQLAVEHFGARDGLPDDELRTLLTDPDGPLWIGSRQSGLLRYDAGRVDALSTREGLPHVYIRALLRDHEGSLWVGTDGGGLARLRLGKFLSYGAPEGLGAHPVFSITEDQRGQIWMGTEGGGLSRYRPGAVTTFTTADGLASDFVISVLGTRDGSVWVGTYGEGLQRYRDGAFTSFGPAEGFPAPSVYALYEDRRGALWIGTGQGLFRYWGGRFRQYTTEQGLSNDLITVICEDPDGRLLVGTYEGGLNILHEGTVVDHVDQEDGLASDLILSLWADEGSVWIGTQDGGLSRLRGGGVRTLTSADGLPSDAILQILPDALGSLWMSSNKGLIRAGLDDLHAAADGTRDALAPEVFNEHDGLRSREFNGGVQPAGLRDSRGRLWFPSIAGAVVFHPEDLPTNTVPPAVHIEAFLVNGSRVSTDVTAGDPVEIGPGSNRLEFDFTALSYVAPEDVRYRYRLEGEDPDWIDAGRLKSAFYTNLAPGTYTFRVVASNNDGVWNYEGAALTFRLAPTYYETWWFRLLVAVGVLGLIAATFALRLRTLQRRHDELEAMVEERTHELREANEALAEASETKSQLMRLVAHDLKNPLGGVREFAKVLRDELDADASHDEVLGLIESTAEHALRMVTQFLDVDALENGRLDFAATTLDLAAMARAAVARFESQARQKIQTFHGPASDERVFVTGDTTWLPVVLDNLISNAIKYTPPRRAIWVSVEQGDGVGVFRVRDEGPGLTAKDKTKLFGKFQKLSARPTGGESSTGLGLSIVKKVVDELGGRIWVESELGQGATFSVELSAAAAPADSPSEAPAFEPLSVHLAGKAGQTDALPDGAAAPDFVAFEAFLAAQSGEGK